MNFKKINFILIAFILLAINNISAQNTCNLKVIITGIKNTEGQIMISINEGAEGWPDDNFLEQRFLPEFTSPEFTVYFHNLPYGNYGIGVLHDKDKNGEMTKNWIGIPKEGFAFSRDYKVVFRAPKYDESNFDLNTPEKIITIKMQY